MSAEIIDGKAISLQVMEELKPAIQELKEREIIPGLAAVLVGENPASKTYVAMKERASERLGINSFVHRLPESITEADLLTLVNDLNKDDKIHGILVQMPVPDHIDSNKILDAIIPEKDVDGFSADSLGKIMSGRENFVPATPLGIMVLLERSGIDPSGKHAVIVGRSNIVGKPLANLLMQKKQGANATVTICHSRTPDVSVFTRQADILIAAIGVPGYIKADMVKPGAVIIDVGINSIDDPSRKRGYRLVGDVDFEAVKEVASAITPVPKGVGPMTIAMLMSNVVKAASN
ncbi:MAG: bifunctional 5,10-methylenetetrahydrofolate dehydrogenase/5,10-methenyltetrahydrofolate cyclohydrolase [Thermoplasmata archaeon]|nr:bifunctional 5,10-methylenetetrahydrofolate dehydrogenase/5,10-methenyltetrahydrofolate cyclohydrolase [Thermoplasmata archaeon]